MLESAGTDRNSLRGKKRGRFAYSMLVRRQKQYSLYELDNEKPPMRGAHRRLNRRDELTAGAGHTNGHGHTSHRHQAEAR
jgi:hypothetical protein